MVFKAKVLKLTLKKFAPCLNWGAALAEESNVIRGGAIIDGEDQRDYLLLIGPLFIW